MQGICGQVNWLKKPMLAYGKSLPRNNEFSLFCPEKMQYYPEKKSVQIFEKFVQSPCPAVDGGSLNWPLLLTFDDLAWRKFSSLKSQGMPQLFSGREVAWFHWCKHTFEAPQVWTLEQYERICENSHDLKSG